MRRLTVAAFGVVLAALVLNAAPVKAALSPAVYERLQKIAPYHLRIKITDVSGGTFGECEIEGTIVEVLRAPEDSLKVGDSVSSAIFCIRPMPLMPSPIVRIKQDRLIEGNVLEGYFESTRQGDESLLRSATYGSGTVILKNE